MTDPNRAVLERFCEAVRNADFSQVPSCYSEDAVHRDLAFNTIQNGRAQIVEFYAVWGSLITNDDYLFSADSICLDDSGQFAIEYTWRTRMDGDFMGVPASGKIFHIRGAGAGQVKDGEITSWSDYYNALSILADLGVRSIPEELLHKDAVKVSAS